MTGGLSRGLAPVRDVLPNGAVVIAQQTAYSPAVTINVAVRAGSLYESDERCGLAWFLGRVIDRGTATRSAADIAEGLDDRGVSLRVSINRHVAALSCTCLSEDFADVLAVLADVTRNPVFPDDEVEKRRAEIVTAIRQDEDNPGVRASEALQALLYGESHPYGRPAKGRITTVERIRREDLLAHHAARFAPSTLLVVIVGDIVPAEAIAHASAAFGDWVAVPSPEREVPPVPARSSRRAVAIAMPDKSQSDIAYGFTSISRLDPAYCSHWVMNTILGQFGLGGRLAENIRERQGMAYYAFSSFDPSLGPGPLVIRAGVDPANVERAVAAIDAEVGALGRDGRHRARAPRDASIPHRVDSAHAREQRRHRGVPAHRRVLRSRPRLRSPPARIAPGRLARRRECRGAERAGSGARRRRGRGAGRGAGRSMTVALPRLETA